MQNITHTHTYKRTHAPSFSFKPASTMLSHESEMPDGKNMQPSKPILPLLKGSDEKRSINISVGSLLTEREKGGWKERAVQSSSVRGRCHGMYTSHLVGWLVLLTPHHTVSNGLSRWTCQTLSPGSRDRGTRAGLRTRRVMCVRVHACQQQPGGCEERQQHPSVGE